MSALQALTIWQPWADLIARGPKRIENRTWAPPRALVGGWLAIHAGKRVDPESWQGAEDIAAFAQLRVPLLEGLRDAEDRDYDAGGGGSKARRAYVAAAVPYGAIVAVARVTGHVTTSDDPWFFGPIGWTLADVVAIEPVVCGGAQGLWTPPDATLALVRERYRAAKRAAEGASARVQP